MLKLDLQYFAKLTNQVTFKGDFSFLDTVSITIKEEQQPEPKEHEGE